MLACVNMHSSAIHHQLLPTGLLQRDTLHVPLCQRLSTKAHCVFCSQVGLGVAAAVACCIKATQHAGEAATQVAACLPATADVLADKDAFRKAEHCIAGMQYNPFLPQYD